MGIKNISLPLIKQTKKENMKTVTLSNDGNSVLIDGVVYDKRKDTEKKEELNTFEDCWNAVKPVYWNHSANTSISDNGSSLFCSDGATLQLPTEKTARQIQAAIKLFVVRHALQGDWEPKPGTSDAPRHVWFNNRGGLLVQELYGQALNTPFAYKSEALAIKSIEIAGDIYKEWFGVNDSESEEVFEPW